MPTPTSPTSPQPGLRARKRAATMRHIQSVALDLFERKGFDQVTIEEVAATAEVSQSSVYRYFGTKEGLVVHDEHDEPLLTTLMASLEEYDIYDAAALALDRISDAHFVEDAERNLRRMRFVRDVPSVLACAYLTMDDVADSLASILSQPDRTPNRNAVEARAVAGSVLYGLFGAVLQWHDAAVDQPLAAAISQALDAIRPQPPVDVV